MDIQKEREVFECEFKQTDYYIAHGDLSTLMLCGDQYALDDVQVSFEMWKAAKAQVSEGYVVVPMEPTEQILNRMTNAPIEVNHLCDNADIFLSEDEARIAYKAMIEALEQKG